MNRIEKKFAGLKRERKKAFIAYITAGDPDMKLTGEAVLLLEKAGCDLVELGIPFSDPLADGPTIQAASQRALGRGATLKRAFEAVGKIRRKSGMPIVFMTYYNPVLRYGVSAFAEDCKRYGVDGVIIPDLPHDEAKDLIKYARANDIATIFLVAPTSTKKRIRDISKLSRGFIYYVSLTGVTGARRSIPQEVFSRVRLLKSVTSKPVAVGFGISSPIQARKVAGVADGVIVGSAIVKIFEKNRGNKGKLLRDVYKFSKGLARAIHNA